MLLNFNNQVYIHILGRLDLKKEKLLQINLELFLLILMQYYWLIHTRSACSGLLHIVVFLWNRKAVVLLLLNLLSDNHVKKQHKKPVRSPEYFCWRDIKVFANGTEHTIIRRLRIYHVINSWERLWLIHGLWLMIR